MLKYVVCRVDPFDQRDQREAKIINASRKFLLRKQLNSMYNNAPTGWTWSVDDPCCLEAASDMYSGCVLINPETGHMVEYLAGFRGAPPHVVRALALRACELEIPGWEWMK